MQHGGQVFSGRVGYEVQVGIGEGTPGAGGGQVRSDHQRSGVGLEHGADGLGDVEVDPAEAGRGRRRTARCIPARS